MLDGGSPAESCGAGIVPLFLCRSWDKAQNYTDLEGTASLSLAHAVAEAVLPLLPGRPCTHITVGLALFQARLCWEFCSPSAAHMCGAAHVF